MKAREEEKILDALQMTGVYVIREDNHQILYFNRWVKEIAPNIETGMICHELWKEACVNCPLLHIGNGTQARSVNYGDPFGKAVEISATRILWEDTIPALVVTLTPYAEVTNHAYRKVLRANLSTNSFNIVKVDDDELLNMEGHLSTLSNWLEGVALNGYIYLEDLERYQEFVQIDRLREKLHNSTKALNCIYRRKAGNTFKWHTLEIVPDSDYTDQNQKVMIFVKDVHDLFKDGLQREGVNIWNQEIINALGEANFAIYVVDLQAGGVTIVRTTEKVKQTAQEGIFLWDNIFKDSAEGYIASEDRKEFAKHFSLQAMKQAWKNGEEKRTLVCRVFLHGVWKYVSVSAYFKERPTRSGYAILAFQDVDERVKKDMERAQQDRRMAAIIQSRYSILNTVDLESGICERIFLREGTLGKHLEGNYNYYIEKALNKSVAEADKKKFEQTFLLDNLRKKAENVKNYKEELFQYRLVNSPVLWVEAHILYIRQGNKIAINILERDITAEKLMEERTHKDLLEKTSIIDSLSSMFFATYYIDLEQDSLRPVTQKKEVSPILGEARNYTQAIHQYAEESICAEDREEYLKFINIQTLRKNLSEEHPLTAFEYRMIPDQNNQSAWIRATVVLSETASDGMSKCALYVAQDVTESKIKEAKEQQALRDACEAANQANTAKSEFMSRMSHDIRTPLNAIIGMTAIAARYLEDQERVEDCLRKITVSSKHLLSLINEVLDMSKIESGKIDLSEEEVNLSDLIDNLITMVRPSLQQKNHNLDVRITNVDHEYVVSDSMRLNQVFMNILGNAIKYTPPGGNIKLEITETSSEIYGYGRYEFVFEDNGIGMSEEFQKRLFEPFSRAEDSRIAKIEGTGLGMTIARNIVRMMSGDITVESEIGKGTQFVVMLSFKLLNTTEENTEKLIDLPVLVVDDDETTCQTTCMILENIGMKGEYVLNGREAVQRVWEHHQANHDYFAVILDWKMPEFDGLDTVKAIRKKVGPDIPIIILSAYDWSDIEEEARLSGVDGFISKPLFKSRLIYLFNQITEKGEAQQLQNIEQFNEAELLGKRVLLAEDNELNREIAEEILGQTGVTVDSVADGQEALKQFEKMGENYYDMIFMDIQMPVMNGYEASTAIRKLPQKDALSIPIIAMTANAFAEDIRQSKIAGMNEHLTKPLDIEQLMKCLATWLGGN